jgi:transposase
MIGIEACASSHHWARALTKLGHAVKLMPPAYVKPYVKRQKYDDAEAIYEVIQRPNMCFQSAGAASRPRASPHQASLPATADGNTSISGPRLFPVCSRLNF